MLLSGWSGCRAVSAAVRPLCAVGLSGSCQAVTLGPDSDRAPLMSDSAVRLSDTCCQAVREVLSTLSGCRALSGAVRGLLSGCQTRAQGPARSSPLRSAPVLCLVLSCPVESLGSAVHPSLSPFGAALGRALHSGTPRYPSILSGSISAGPVSGLLRSCVLCCLRPGPVPPMGSSRAVRCVFVYHSYSAEPWYS